MYIESSIESKVNNLFQQTIPTIHDPLGIEFTYLSTTKVQASMPVDDRTKQPFGLLHGGASVVLAESVASIGAWLNIDDSKFAAVGVEINANHLRAVKEGYVIASATPIHLGKMTQVWGIIIEDSTGRQTSVSRCTLAVTPIIK